MKWIFYAMVVINLALFGWIANKPEPQNQVIRTSLKDVGDLKIVSDVELAVMADFQKNREAEHSRKQQQRSEKKVIEKKDVVFLDDGIESVCRRLGPFPERKTAVGIADGLASFRLAPKVVNEKQVNILGYWAILPALSTKDEAELLVEKLKSKGIKDVRRFTSGNLINAISLGLFSTEVNAKRRARSVEKQGFLAVVQSKEEESEQFWLEFTQPRSLTLPLDGIRQNYPELQNKPCPGIAQK